MSHGHATLRRLAASRKAVLTSTLLRSKVFCLQSRHRRSVWQIMRRQASAVVAMEHEKKILWSPQGKRERGDQSAILPRISQGEKFQKNSVKAELG